jgi:hypothetical protein
MQLSHKGVTKTPSMCEKKMEQLENEVCI